MATDSLRFLGDPVHPVNCTCDILDKELSAFNYVQYMFDRTNRMFRYTGLPNTIPDYLLEYMLQIYGSVAILKYEGKLYALRCEFGGPPDPYYRPTQAIAANPGLGLTGTFRIVNYFPPYDKDTWDSYPPCVRVHNDSQLQGLLPLFARYASQMSENDVSIRSAQINLRQQTVIAADTGPEIESARAYIADLEQGKLSSIQKRPFSEGVKVMNAQTGQSNAVIQLIELQQYLKASWYNEIGLNSNFNMKRQYISSDEVAATSDIMLPLIDNMLYCRQQAIEEINREFGTSISVEKDSAWEKKQMQSDLSIPGTTLDQPLEDTSSVDETPETEQIPASLDDIPSVEGDPVVEAVLVKAAEIVADLIGKEEIEQDTEEDDDTDGQNT